MPLCVHKTSWPDTFAQLSPAMIWRGSIPKSPVIRMAFSRPYTPQDEVIQGQPRANFLFSFAILAYRVCFLNSVQEGEGEGERERALEHKVIQMPIYYM